MRYEKIGRHSSPKSKKQAKRDKAKALCIQSRKAEKYASNGDEVRFEKVLKNPMRGYDD